LRISKMFGKRVTF